MRPCYLLLLQADNILVSEEGDVVLADFGVAAARMRPVSMVNLDMRAVMATTFVGTVRAHLCCSSSSSMGFAGAACADSTNVVVD